MALSLRQKSALLKLGGAVGFLEEARLGKYALPNYVIRALEIIEGVYDELLGELTKEELKDLHSWMLKLQRKGEIKVVPEDEIQQLISVMFNLYDIELVFKKKRRPIHYVFLVLFKFLKKKMRNGEVKSKVAESIVDYASAQGFTLEQIEAKAKAYAEKIKREGL